MIRSDRQRRRPPARAKQRRLRPVFEALEDRRLLAITVDTLADGIGVPGVSLREAIDLAASGDTINFAVTGQINLTVPSQLIVSKNLTINGPGADQLTIRAFDPSPAIKNGDGRRVFLIDNLSDALADVTISGLTLTGADTNFAGGAIFSRENLVIQRSVITGNTTTSGGISGGGGIFSSNGPVVRNSLTVRDSSITDNSAPFAEGGGIRNRYGNLVIERTTISGNFAATVGGGISAADGGVNVELIDSTVHSNNSVSGGGGIFLAGASVIVRNSTISGNHAGGNGGGMDSINSALTVQHSTITNNSIPGTSDGGGIFFSGIGSVALNHSIVSGNFDGNICIPPFGCGPLPGDVFGPVTARYSVIGIVAGGTFSDQGGNVFGSPGLRPLSDNGGPTLTHLPQSGSRPINAGDPTAQAGQNSVPLRDQRGAPFTRLAGGRIDIGAVEVQTLLGDFDFDLDLDGDDIDLLIAAIVDSGPPATFDLTSDGLVDLADRDEWLSLAGALNLPTGNPYRLGDANLDGVVDVHDFDIWNSNKFSNIARWTRGDFNADGGVDVTDFNIWNANKFTSSNALERSVQPIRQPRVKYGRIESGAISLSCSPFYQDDGRARPDEIRRHSIG